jgi:protein subunit release factor A
MEISEDDLEVVVFRSRSNDCAVRLVHLPSGYVFDVTDFETVAENKERALALLREALERANT